MSIRANGKLTLFASFIYFTFAAAGTAWLVVEGKHFIFRSLDYFLAALATFYAVAALAALAETLRTPRWDAPAPQLSRAKQKFIRTAGLLLPVPIVAYSLFFASTVHSFCGCDSDWGRTQVLLSLEEPLFGHQRVQRLMMYFGSHSWESGNLVLAKKYVLACIDNTRQHMKNHKVLARRERYLSRLCAALNEPAEARYWLGQSDSEMKQAEIRQ
jgi:hypothetical protein